MWFKLIKCKHTVKSMSIFCFIFCLMPHNTQSVVCAPGPEFFYSDVLCYNCTTTTLTQILIFIIYWRELRTENTIHINVETLKVEVPILCYLHIPKIQKHFSQHKLFYLNLVVITRSLYFLSSESFHNITTSLSK